MARDTSEKSAERFLAIQKSREESKKKREKEWSRRRLLNLKRGLKEDSNDIRREELRKSLKNFVECIAWAAALTITEVPHWREQSVSKTTDLLTTELCPCTLSHTCCRT